MTPTPKSDGYAMPAEWTDHAACWMAWPANRAVWGARLEAAQEAYITVAQAIAAFEPVTIVAPTEKAADVSLRAGRGISVFAHAHDDAWFRDSGPTFVVRGDGETEVEAPLAGVDWQFNAWGEIYPDYQNDAAIASAVLDHLGLPTYAAPLVLEGGSIHVNGEGSLLTTRQCLLNPNRNPNLDKTQIEGHLRDYLGVEKIIWLAGGLRHDETDGHVDNVACFARPGLVLALKAGESDDNREILDENLGLLEAATDARGQPLEIVEIVEPAPVFHEGARLPLSYINFYLANGAVIVPQFDDAQDKAALATLKDVFAEREIVPVDGLDIAYGGGGIHCITQQQPAVAVPEGD